MRIVFRNIDDAFPFHITGWKTDFSGEIRDALGQGGNLQGGSKKQIEALLIGLNEFNEEIQAFFRAAYVAFVQNPCADQGHFRNEVERINQSVNDLKRVNLQILGLIELSRTSQPGSEIWIAAFKEILQMLGPKIPAQAAETALRDASQDVQSWLGRREASSDVF